MAWEHTEKESLDLGTGFLRRAAGRGRGSGWGRPHPLTPGAASSNPAGCGLSLQSLVASNLNLKPGKCLRVQGEVAPEAKR